MLIARVFVLLVCFPVHECAHALIADRLGDHTAKKRGRVTLNPFKHLDFMGTVLILLIGVGYAKPVPVNIRHFKKPKRDFALTAAAGPLSNLLMAVLFLFILKAIPYAKPAAETAYMLRTLVFYAAYINVGLAMFNLIPIPPLDGSRVVMAFLPDGAYNSMLKRERYVMGALLIAVMYFNQIGFSPVSAVTKAVFSFFYKLIL